MRVSKWLAGREKWCYFLVLSLCFDLGGSFTRLCFKFEVTREQHPRLRETVAIPPISRKEVNFNHVSRQECKRKFMRPKLESVRILSVWLLKFRLWFIEIWISWDGWEIKDLRPDMQMPVHFTVELSMQCMQTSWVGGRVRAKEGCSMCKWGRTLRRRVMLEDVHRKIIWL